MWPRLHQSHEVERDFNSIVGSMRHQVKFAFFWCKCWQRYLASGMGSDFWKSSLCKRGLGYGGSNDIIGAGFQHAVLRDRSGSCGFLISSSFCHVLASAYTFIIISCKMVLRTTNCYCLFTSILLDSWFILVF